MTIQAPTPLANVQAPIPAPLPTYDNGRADDASIRRRRSPAARLSRLNARITDQMLGDDVVINGVSGRGILHMPTGSKGDDFTGVMVTMMVRHCRLEYARSTFPQVMRGDRVIVNGQAYRAVGDEETLSSDLTSGATGRFGDGEVMTVWLDSGRRGR